MESLSAQILRRLFEYLAVEDQQVLRMSSMHFARLIRVGPADFLVHGIKYRKQEFVGLAADTDKMFSARICDVAAYHGRLDLLESAIKNGYAPTERTCYEAARGGHARVLELLYTFENLRTMECKARIDAGVAESGLAGHTLNWPSIYEYESSNRWYDHIPHELRRTAFVTAAFNRHTPVIEHLCKYYGPGGHLDKYLTAEVCAAAAVGGHLDTLKSLRSGIPTHTYRGKMVCPWDSHTILNALLNGHDQVALWAAENDCPWDPLTFPPSMTARLNKLLGRA